MIFAINNFILSTTKFLLCSKQKDKAAFDYIMEEHAFVESFDWLGFYGNLLRNKLMTCLELERIKNIQQKNPVFFVVDFFKRVCVCKLKIFFLNYGCIFHLVMYNSLSSEW